MVSRTLSDSRTGDWVSEPGPLVLAREKILGAEEIQPPPLLSHLPYYESGQGSFLGLYLDLF